MTPPDIDTAHALYMHPVGVLGFAAFLAGLLAWMRLDDWRWAALGTSAMPVLIAVGSAIAERKRSKR